MSKYHEENHESSVDSYQIFETIPNPNSAGNKLYEELGDPEYDWGEPSKSDFQTVMDTLAG